MSGTLASEAAAARCSLGCTRAVLLCPGGQVGAEGGGAIHSLVINKELCELNPTGQVQPGVRSRLTQT